MGTIHPDSGWMVPAPPVKYYQWSDDCVLHKISVLRDIYCKCNSSLYILYIGTANTAACYTISVEWSLNYTNCYVA